MANTYSNGFTQSGVLYRTFDTESKQHGDKTFYTRKFILCTAEEYNGQEYFQYIPCELRGETKTAILDRFEEGLKVRIHCNLRGVKYNPKDENGVKNMNEEKYFSSVDVWKIENMNAPAPPVANNAGNQQQSSYNSAPNFNPNPETIDDLPF